MLRAEAIRLLSQQEQSHGCIISGPAIPATHDRRHAGARIIGEDAEPLPALGVPLAATNCFNLSPGFPLPDSADCCQLAQLFTTRSRYLMLPVVDRLGADAEQPPEVDRGQPQSAAL